MAIKTYRKGDFGMVWDFNTGIDLTSWVELEVQFRKPQTGTVVVKSSTLAEVDDTGTPSDTKVRYIVESDLLDESGKWQAVARVKFTGKDWKQYPASYFMVEEDFDTLTATA